jgi:hypothetical protein
VIVVPPSSDGEEKLTAVVVAAGVVAPAPVGAPGAVVGTLTALEGLDTDEVPTPLTAATVHV